MTIATKINDIIALGETSHDPPTLSEDELRLVSGSGGDNTWAASDAAYAAQQSAHERLNTAMQNGLEALGNLEMGSATRAANEAYNAYTDMQAATQDLYHALDSDAANYDAGYYVDQQISNGHDYSPMDANMTNYDGSPGVGQSY